MLRRRRTLISLLCLFFFVFLYLNLIEFGSLTNEEIVKAIQLNNLDPSSIFSNNFLFYQRVFDSLNDNKTVVNPHNLKYLINNGHKICKRDSNEDILLLAFIPILPDRFRERQLIRLSWADRNLFPEIQHVFVMGNATEEINLRLKEENKIFGDILQEEFIEDYYNLTLKTLMGIKWVSKYCPNAKFVLKVDDDVIVNTFSLLKYLKNFNSTLSNTFLCRVWKDPIVNRNESSKFYVSYSEYPNEIFKNYCDGPAYLMTGDLVPKLYQRSLFVRRIKFEDVYLGMIANDLNASFINLTRYYSFKKHWYHDQVKSIDKTKYNLRYFIYVKDMTDFLTGWNILKEKIVNNYLKF